MTDLVRYENEGDDDFTERILRKDGVIRAFDCTYRLWDQYGNKTGFTRLAASIHTLRHNGKGWDIKTTMRETDETSGRKRRLAVYTAVRYPEDPMPVDVEPAPKKSGPCPKCARVIHADQPTVDPRIWSAKCYTDGKVYIRVDQ